MYTAKGEKPLVALPSIRQHILQYSPSWQAVHTGVIMVVLLKDNQQKFWIQDLPHSAEFYAS